MISRSYSAGILLLFLLQGSPVQAASFPLLEKVSALADASRYGAVVDTRALSSCTKSSLRGAMCLPLEEIMAPQRRLANWSGILWLLGSAGLTGREHVLVIGQQSSRRDVIAAVLLLAGQYRVSVLEQPVSTLITDNGSQFAGALRATTRTSVYTARMRSDLIVLRNELKHHVSGGTVLLDGRSEAEFYGVSIRASRGGHLPGATHSALSEWRSDPQQPAETYRSLNPVAYSHDTFESLVYLVALHAAGVPARVFLAGWVEWAADGALPVDSVSYPRAAVTPLIPTAANSSATDVATRYNSKVWIALATLFTVGILVVGFYAGRATNVKNA